MCYKADMESVRAHKVPNWYEDEKIGIFIHWGAYSVPAWAPPTGELGTIADEEWFCNNPYSEWYLNSIRVGRGPTYEHHVKTYGEDFPYENFIDMWKAEAWDPAEWAGLFKKAGARYVVPVTKHHDGLCLWDSKFTDYTTVHRGPKRDIIDELAGAVRGKGMRFGVYYSGLIDWRFAKQPMYTSFDVNHPDCISYEYADYAYNQALELVEKYKPSILWNDIGWPYKGELDLPYLFSQYYNTVEEGVVNDRWNGIWHDYTTKEYEHGEMHVADKWEACRGLGLSFAYNQIEGPEHILSPGGLVSLMVETVAHNGNLLINVGPRADGTIPEAQSEALLGMGAWLEENGEAIYGTRPFTRQKEAGPNGEALYYTQKGGAVYLIVDAPRPGSTTITCKGLGGYAEKARALGKARAGFTKQGDDLVVALADVPENAPAIAVRLER